MEPKTTIENVETIGVILPWAAGSSFLCAVAAIAYRVFRPRFPVRVNCWFCCKDTTVPFGNRNCWDCPSCDQYNGFTDDDDYNKPIPSQYAETLNYPVPAANLSRTFVGGDNDLCDRCNRNQLLKVKQLANFVAYDEAHYEVEVEAYRRHLDNVYQLCKACDFHVQQVLERQDRELWRKLQQVRHTPDTTVSEHNSSVYSNPVINSVTVPPRHVRVLRVASLLCAILLFLTDMCTLGRLNKISFSHLTLLPSGIEVGVRMVGQQACVVVVIGFLLAIIAIYASGKLRLHIAGAGSMFAWLLLFLLHCRGGTLTPSTPILSNHQDNVLLRCVTATITVLLMACSIVFVKQIPIRHITLRKHTRRRRDGDIFVSETCDSASLYSDKDRSSNVVPPVANGNGCYVRDLETISLDGLASKRQNEVFPVPHSVPSHSNPLGLPSASLRHRPHRPLISPARFKAPAADREREGMRQGYRHHAGHFFTSSSSVQAPTISPFTFPNPATLLAPNSSTLLAPIISTTLPAPSSALLPPAFSTLLAPSSSPFLAPSLTSLYAPSLRSTYAASDISSAFSDVRLANDQDTHSDRSAVSSRSGMDANTPYKPTPTTVPFRRQRFVTFCLLGISIAVNFLLGMVYLFGLKK